VKESGMNDSQLSPQLGWGYFIPAPVLFDKHLPEAAKSLYCLIEGLTQGTGACWASTEYLAQPFDWTPEYVRMLIKQLSNQGHIRIFKVERFGKHQREIRCMHRRNSYNSYYKKDDDKIKNTTDVVEKPTDIEKTPSECSTLSRKNTTDVVEKPTDVVEKPLKNRALTNESLDTNTTDVGKNTTDVVKKTTDVVLHNNDEHKSNNKITIKYSGGKSPPEVSWCFPKVEFKKRYQKDSLPYKLSEILIDLVSSRSKQYDRYLTTEEGRYLLIQKNAKPFDLMLNRDKRDINELIEVLQWSQEDFFWKNNIRSADTLRRQYSVLVDQMKEQGIGCLANDPNPELTQKLIKIHKGLINNQNLVLKPVEHSKFIEGSKRAVKFFNQWGVPQEEWVECIFQCIERNTVNINRTPYPGHYCSDHTWEVLMPMLMEELGFCK
jgi:hypothetical protein